MTDFHSLTIEQQTIELKRQDIELRREELQEQRVGNDLKRTQMAIDFARFGFRGTLGGALAGIVLIGYLATLDAFSDRLDLGGYVYVGMSVTLLAGAIAYGYFSLWSRPKLAASILKNTLSIEHKSS